MIYTPKYKIDLEKTDFLQRLIALPLYNDCINCKNHDNNHRLIGICLDDINTLYNNDKLAKNECNKYFNLGLCGISNVNKCNLEIFLILAFQLFYKQYRDEIDDLKSTMLLLLNKVNTDSNTYSDVMLLMTDMKKSYDLQINDLKKTILILKSNNKNY